MVNISDNWKYLEENHSLIDDLNDQMNWQPIDLPHTWNQWDATDLIPGYRRDASWYQKELFIDKAVNARYFIYFEGSNITTEVYANNQLAGTHIGGYVGFEIDITPYVKRGASNIISIRVDNRVDRSIIPSQKADFFIYGGITRDVWLKTLPELHIASTRISTPEVSAESASTQIELKIEKPELCTGNCIIKSQIVDLSSNKVVAEVTTALEKLADEPVLSFPTVKTPRLWSPEAPNLYEVRTKLLADDQIIDATTDRIGYRWFHFEDHGAFFLNGERLLLRGTHRHEEHAGYGAAMPNELHRADIEAIKSMGANFLRLAHYPQDPEVYRACDELGIIVWDEIPWCRGGMGDDVWKSNTENLLREQIHQNYNHPSILFWSLGNEIYWLPDYEGGDDETVLNSYLTKLNDIAHDLDPFRLTAIRKYYAGSDIVDVFSPSIWSGWYAGVYTNYENTLASNQEKYPRFLHMEYGGSSHLGRHTENPITGSGLLSEDNWAEVANQVNVKNIAKGGDWSENYIVDLFDWYLGVTETHPTFAGNAQWAFKDFGTPLRPENAIPYMNQKGLVDRSGEPKDAYYVFKSYWSKEPFTYIESHTWTHRYGPPGEMRNVSVFSNCDRVELWQDDRSLGIKDRKLGEFPACGLHWDLLFGEGKNTLIAHGYQNDEKVATDTIVVNYGYTQVGTPSHISLSSRLLSNGNHLVEARMMDDNDQQVIDYERPVYFSCDGAGELLVNYGTPTRSQIIQMANGYAAIELAPANGGTATIEVRNQDFKGSYLTIDFDKQEKR